jgi:hypothetical protein
MVALSSVPAQPRRRRRGALFAAAIVGVAALHWLALATLGPQWFEPEGPPGAPEPMRVRSVAAPESPAPAAAMPAPTATATAPTDAAQPARKPPPREPAAFAPPVEPVGPTAAVETVTAAPTEAASAASSAAPIEAAQGAAAALVELPVYRTRVPAAGRWNYRLQRGMAVGEAELDWQPQPGAGYEMRLQGRIAGVTVLDWASHGAIDGAGIAPERYAIRRRGRDHQAANFQRDANKITFSGPTHELPLWPGVQDRLTWMLQLAAIVDAAPERFGLGARIVLMVVGARGGGDVWAFTVAGPDRIGETPALKLVREPRRARDVQVELWLDSARGHLPLKAVLAPTEGGAPLELQWQP